MEDEFTIMYNNLVKATVPEDIFGTLNSSTADEKIQELKRIYHSMIKLVHPDCHNSDPKEKHMAMEATRILVENYTIAENAISSGHYGTRKHIKISKTEVSFHIGDYDYKIFPGNIEGDFCQVFFGERSKNGDLEKICLKIAKDAEDTELILNESQILKAILHKSVPIYLDTFQVGDGRAANVLRMVEDSYDLNAIREYFPNGLPQEHAVWVFDRLLSMLGYLHSNNVIHGAIEPSNILVTPHNHNGFLIDYLLSIPDAHLPGARYIGVNNYSAPEISAGAIPHPASDMYSLGKSMVYLIGGEGSDIPSGIDPSISEFLAEFLRNDPSRRKDDAWKAWYELKELRTKVFGAPSQFLELKLGGR